MLRSALFGPPTAGEDEQNEEFVIVDLERNAEEGVIGQGATPQPKPPTTKPFDMVSGSCLFCRLTFNVILLDLLARMQPSSKWQPR